MTIYLRRVKDIDRDCLNHGCYYLLKATEKCDTCWKEAYQELELVEADFGSCSGCVFYKKDGLTCKEPGKYCGCKYIFKVK